GLSARALGTRGELRRRFRRGFRRGFRAGFRDTWHSPKVSEGGSVGGFEGGIRQGFGTTPKGSISRLWEHVSYYRRLRKGSFGVARPEGVFERHARVGGPGRWIRD